MLAPLVFVDMEFSKHVLESSIVIVNRQSQIVNLQLTYVRG